MRCVPCSEHTNTILTEAVDGGRLWVAVTAARREGSVALVLGAERICSHGCAPGPSVSWSPFLLQGQWSPPAECLGQQVG